MFTCLIKLLFEFDWKRNYPVKLIEKIRGK